MHGLYIEGARFDQSTNQLQRSRPKVLVEELGILAVVPIEAHRLKLQVCMHPNGMVNRGKEREEIERESKSERGVTGFSGWVQRRLQVTSTNVRLYLHTYGHTHIHVCMYLQWPQNGGVSSLIFV